MAKAIAFLFSFIEFLETLSDLINTDNVKSLLFSVFLFFGSRQSRRTANFLSFILKLLLTESGLFSFQAGNFLVDWHRLCHNVSARGFRTAEHWKLISSMRA